MVLGRGVGPPLGDEGDRGLGGLSRVASPGGSPVRAHGGSPSPPSPRPTGTRRAGILVTAVGGAPRRTGAATPDAADTPPPTALSVGIH